jgi:DNA-binding MarR family transcriptional regulator
MDTSNNNPFTIPCHCANLRRATRMVTQFYDRMLAPSGLKNTQYSLLRYVEQLEPVNMTELAKYMSLDRTTLVRNVKPLEAQGLLVSASGSDLRTRELRLTERGHEVLQEASISWQQAQENLEAFLGRQQLETLLGLLEKLHRVTV